MLMRVHLFKIIIMCFSAIFFLIVQKADIYWQLYKSESILWLSEFKEFKLCWSDFYPATGLYQLLVCLPIQ